MKKLSCKDIVGIDDDFQAKGKTNDEVKDLFYSHVEQAHPEKVSNISEQERMSMDQKMEDALNSQP